MMFMIYYNINDRTNQSNTRLAKCCFEYLNDQIVITNNKRISTEF